MLPTTPDSSVALKVTVTSFDSDETSTELGVNVRSDNIGALDSSTAFVMFTSISIEADAEPVLAVKVTL